MPLSLISSANPSLRPVAVSRHLQGVSFVGCAGLLVGHLTCDSRDCRPGSLFAYELRRPNRFFRVEFDLGRPVPAPPPPWRADGGAETTAN